MKRVFFIIILLTFLRISYSNAQTMMSFVKSKVGEHLSNNINDRYLGNLEITDAKTSGQYVFVEGTFDYKFKFFVGGTKTERRKFKAKLKQVLDEVTVINLCYHYIALTFVGDGVLKKLYVQMVVAYHISMTLIETMNYGLVINHTFCKI